MSGRGIGRLADLVFPGLRRGLKGEPVALGRLAAWIALWALAIVRRERLAATVAGGSPDEWLALATLVGGLAASLLAGGRGPGAGDRGEEGVSLGRIAWDRFRRHRMAGVGLVLLATLALAALLTPYLAPFDPAAQPDVLATRFQAPSLEHPMGTDRFGRDVFSRVLYGARVSLGIGFAAVTIAVTLGTLVGAVAGYVGGWVDTVAMRFVDLLLSFPRLVFLIALVAVFEPSLGLVTLVLGLTGWMGTSRIVRGEVLSLREAEYVEAARALGFSGGRILGRHVLPNALTPVIVAATLGIGNTILAEAALSFLGLGVQAPLASWGNMVASGRQTMLEAWWITTFPGLAIVFTVMSFNLVGDGLRDALDPRRSELP